jgi:UDP-2,3-diacylglucosamine hydrolase
MNSMVKEEHIVISLQSGKKLFFLSDMHLGAPDNVLSREREQKLLRFLDAVEQQAQAVFFVGDSFDFWFEYNKVVPKGFVRFLAKLAAMRDRGIEIFIFTGNHDLWLGDYLKDELGATIFKQRIILDCAGKSIFLAHGDGLGPGDRKYKLLKKVFTNRFCQWLFRWLHPDIGVALAQFWSRHNFTDPGLEVFQGEHKEWLIQYCSRKLQQTHHDFFLMGHRHLPMDIQLAVNSRYINLGDWIINCNYAAFDGQDVQLIKFG